MLLFGLALAASAVAVGAIVYGVAVTIAPVVVNFFQRALNGGPVNPGGCSFSADTLVATPSGEQAIGSLHVGDTVLAYNSVSGKVQRQTIQHVWINDDHDLVEVQLVTEQQLASTPHMGASGADIVQTTANHPWLTTDRGWVIAGDLYPGELVMREDGTTAEVLQVRTQPGTAIRYNLEVSNVHTFAVGSAQYVVHNSCGLGE